MIEARLREIVERTTPRLLAWGEARSSRSPAPDKWSAKHVIGHLVDSATVNHGRFVRAVSSDDLVAPGYAQDDWVGVQRYVEADWGSLVGLWSALNLHLARVMAAMPPAARTRTRTRHNLHELAWQPVAADQPVTLEAFLGDYVGHLEHHLRQAFAAAGESLAEGDLLEALRRAPTA